MKPRKQPYLVNIGLAVAALCIGTAKSAETVIDWTNSGDIPDNNPTGFADTRSISLDSSLVITGLEVRLNLSGGWNGDLYATLVHDSGFSVLLNRPGTTFSNPAGSGSSGMNIVLSDNAASDIHTAIGSSGFITGTYQPDARTSDPALVTSSSPRSAFLSSFNETAVNGSWTLFLADDAEVDTSTLLGWGLTFTSESRPFVYWDANASGSGIGGSGTWSASGNSWATTNTGTSAAAANTASQLVFRGNTGTVTVAGTVAPQAGMRFESTGYELAGGGISLAGPDAASNRITAVSGVRASISSDLTGSNGMTKDGGGAVRLTGINNYAGDTLVEEGVLLVDGELTGNGAVHVASGATLGGSGTITGALNVTGVLSPGASIETLMSGDLTFLNGSTFDYEVDSSATIAAGGDLQIVAGNLGLNGDVGLVLADISSSPATYANGTVFALINYIGAWNGGRFRVAGNTINDGGSFFALNTEWVLDYNSQTGGGNFNDDYLTSSSFVTLTAVPEPAAALLGGIGWLILMRRRR